MAEVLDKVSYNDVVNQIEAALVKGEAVECPVRHVFTPGLYCREVLIPAGAIVTSKIHKTQHPFVMSQGSLSIIKEDGGLEFVSAPFIGITESGTRRVAYAIEDTIWTTFHVTDITPENTTIEAIEKAVNLIEQEIIEPYDNPLLEENKMEELQ